jgi:hypothetical protein
MWFVVCVGCADRFIADDGIGMADMLCEMLPSVYIHKACEHLFLCAQQGREWPTSRGRRTEKTPVSCCAMSVRAGSRQIVNRK